MSSNPSNDVVVLSNKCTDFHRIINWERNRPPDMCRVKEIAEDITTRNATWTDGLILIWTKPDGTLECYDGIHRVYAARQVEHTVYLRVVYR